MNNDLNYILNDALIKISNDDSYGVDIIYNTIGSRMLSVAIGVVKDRQLAEDVVQESFVKLVKSIRQYQYGTNAYAWICKIVRNTSLNKLKSITKIKTSDIEEFHNIASCENFESRVENNLVVQKLMLQLSRYEQKIIYLKYYLDMTVRDIAKELKLSKSKIHKDIIKCESFMKNLINKDKS